MVMIVKQPEKKSRLHFGNADHDPFAARYVLLSMTAADAHD